MLLQEAGMSQTNKTSFMKWLQQNLVLVGIIVLVIVTALVEPKFLQPRNLTNVMKQLSALPFVALGMTFVIICGFINLTRHDLCHYLRIH